MNYEVKARHCVTPCPHGHKVKKNRMFDFSDYPHLEGKVAMVGSCACRTCENYDSSAPHVRGTMACKLERA
jgi:hypothetical protein